jgi:hypothetical protein
MDAAREVFPKLDQAKTREDFVEAAKWLKGRADPGEYPKPPTCCP